MNKPKRFPFLLTGVLLCAVGAFGVFPIFLKALSGGEADPNFTLSASDNMRGNLFAILFVVGFLMAVVDILFTIIKKISK